MLGKCMPVILGNKLPKFEKFVIVTLRVNSLTNPNAPAGRFNRGVKYILDFGEFYKTKNVPLFNKPQKVSLQELEKFYEKSAKDFFIEHINDKKRVKQLIESSSGSKSTSENKSSDKKKKKKKEDN